jgi:hypothetical protein
VADYNLEALYQSVVQLEVFSEENLAIIRFHMEQGSASVEIAIYDFVESEDTARYVTLAYFPFH